MSTTQPTSDVTAARAETPRKKNYWRTALWSVAFILVSAVTLPSASYLISYLAPAAEAQSTDAAANPRAEYWREVREGNQGYSTAVGRDLQGNLINPDGGVLIQNNGQNWRQLRNGVLTTYGAWFMAGVVALIVLYFLIKGRQKLTDGRSGVTIKRWNLFERFVHAYTAVLFIALGITGLSMLFGRAVLIPLLGPEGFAAWASVSLTVHNVGGALFAVGVALMFIMWVWHNIPNSTDMKWLKSGGGIIGNAHPSAGRMNAGEKIWFWFIMTVGLAVILSGFVWNFPQQSQAWLAPYFADTRTLFQLAHVIHATLAIGWIGLFLGHAYIATLGTEGAMSGMANGYVDVNWAKQHHDLWYEKVKDKAPTKSEFGADANAPSGAAQSTA